MKYPWLRYSEQDNGGYCLPCVLFARSTNLRSDPGILVKNPLTKFQKALESLNKHAEKFYHKTAVVQMDAFLKVMTNQQPSIRGQLSEAASQLVASNRKKLHSIIETIVLCGRQNISLRGHRDSGLDVEHRANASLGNFWALLQFRVAAGDVALAEHLGKARRNAMYTSPGIQNQLIDILGDHVRGKILNRVKKAQFFSVIADEVTDCSNKEQLRLVVRYVNPDDFQIREDLVSFIECDSGITGRAIADKVISFLSTHGLDPTKLRGQAYDGAGNMAGKTKGAAALISSQYPLALYLHCASHSLNLAVVKSLDEACVRNMIGVVNRISIFFSAHPKRQRKLEEAIDSTQPQSSIHKLKDLCRTRWIERIDALDRFKTLYPSIAACFESISSDGSAKWTPDSLTDASTLLLAISTTEFLSALVIASGSLNYSLALTRSLQAEAKDIVQAVAEIDHLKTVLRDVREKVDVYHGKWFSKVEEMCECVGIQPSLPRRCGRQRHRSNVPAQTPTEYYRRTITVPMLDQLLSEMVTRFSKHQQTALKGLYLIPSVLSTKPMEDITPSLCQLEEMYGDDLPHRCSLQSEVHTWYLKWKRQEEEHGKQSLPTTVFFTLPHASSLFPNIKVLLLILCSLPVTSCSAERSFSGLKRIKTALRSTMNNERLTSLTLLHLHRDIDINIPDIIDEFSRRHPRRIELGDILAT